MKIAIIINAKRLTSEMELQLKSRIFVEKYNINYDLFFPEPEEFETVLNQIKSQSYNAYIIGGGDGSVRIAAQVLVETDAVVAILPLGSFNLLAKTLEYPTDLDAVFQMVKNNKTKHIDLIQVNDKIVINHAWIGLYFYILKMRKKHQAIIGKSRLLKIIFSGLNLFKLLPIYNLKLTINNQQMEYNTCLVYIGNNEYNEKASDLGVRKTLSVEHMSVLIINSQTRWQLFKCILSIIFYGISRTKDIIQFSTNELTISAQSNLINMVLDGDLFKLETPLNFSIYHKKLTVLVP